MPHNPQPTLSLRSTPPAVNLAGKDRFHRPLLRLVLHFVRLILQSGHDASSSELNLSLGGLLALLAVPSGIISVLLFEKYSTFLRILRGGPLRMDVYAASLPDKYFLIVCSMAMTAMVAVLKWDRILPSRQDYFQLAPLPLRLPLLFSANVIAVVFVVALFAVDVNVLSSVLFPAVVLSDTEGGLWENLQFMGVHVLCVLLASAFSFLACFSLLGSLMLILPYSVFRRISRVVRVFLIMAALALLCSSFAIPPLLRPGATAHHALLRFLPSVWYLALYQQMQGRANPFFDSLATVGWKAIAILLAVSTFCMLLSYRRVFVRIPESDDFTTSERRWNLSWLLALVDRLLGNSGFQSACYRFSLRVLLRSEAHFLTVGAFVGVGLVAASQMALSFLDTPPTESTRFLPNSDILAAPLAVAYCLIVGLRFTLEIPAERNANWIYRIVLGPQKGETRTVVKKLILTIFLPLVIVPCFVTYSWIWGTRVGLLHAAYILVLSTMLADLMLLRFHKVPFASGLPAGGTHIILIIFSYAVGFLFFTNGAASLESWMLYQPRLFAIMPLFWLVWWIVLARWKRDTSEEDGEFIYESRATKAVQTLDLESLE